MSEMPHRDRDPENGPVTDEFSELSPIERATLKLRWVMWKEAALDIRSRVIAERLEIDKLSSDDNGLVIGRIARRLGRFARAKARLHREIDMIQSDPSYEAPTEKK